MIRVSTAFFCAGLNALRREHGPKMVTQEDIDRMIALLGEAEAAFMALPPDEQAKRRKRR